MPIEVRRQQVLDAALRLISERGYGAATMEAIAREADLAKPVVYNAYPSRGELLEALLEREQQRAFGALVRALPSLPPGGNPVKALAAWLRALSYAVAEHPEPWRLALMPAGETPEPVRQRVEAGRELALAQVRTLVEAFLAQQPALKSLDPELATHAVIGAAERVATLMLDDPESFPPDRLADFGESLLRSFRPG